MATRQDWLEGRATATEERDLHDQGEITDCEYEFGPHDDHADCQRMMDSMSTMAPVETDYYAEAYNRELEEQSLGRPLFPNEY